MICVELSFTDDPARLAARPAHRANLATLHEKGDLLIAGPWHDDSGALLIFTVDQPAVDEIIAADPYFSTPGVTILSIRPYLPVVTPSPA